MDFKRLSSGLVKRLRRGVPRTVETMCYPLLSLTYQHTCPVCGKRVKGFLPLSQYYASNKMRWGNPYNCEDAETLNYRHYSCPHCAAADRDRLYALYLRRALAPLCANKAIVLLDIAPSAPLRALLLRDKRVVYRSADLYARGVDDIVDITSMSIYAENTYDAFVCSHVLEHVEDDRKALSELFRILKPDGWGILMVPINLAIDEIDEDPSVTDEAERWRRFGQFDHVRLYSKRGFLQRVKEAGFSVDQLGIDWFGNQAFQRHGITSKSVLYVVEKR